MKNRNVLNFEPSNGYPAGKNIYYECLRCGSVLPSQPEDNQACSCCNVVIDVDAGRVSIRDHSQFRVFIENDAGS